MAKDKLVVEAIMKSVEEGANIEKSCLKILRLGSKKENSKPRPLKVVFKDGSGLKRKVIKGKEERKWDAKFSGIKVSPDRTQLEREQYRNLVKELVDRKEKGEQNIGIRNNKIVTLSSGPASDKSGSKRNGQ